MLPQASEAGFFEANAESRLRLLMLHFLARSTSMVWAQVEEQQLSLAKRCLVLVEQMVQRESFEAVPWRDNGEIEQALEEPGVGQ